ncbi:alpha/beta fold hydrolase [Flavobacterium selenitireducens]|uniref:alpha/beta fold hydrolase n=1 Tax=Flavobacterium selenitireducens TaxID=2722704 RepID=UPI00168AFE1A|nr:alpha/beta hydrolase [Flavobacterium selenitireducens]MBD3582039.1 alpha/beta hydrolase [Flavobacterium selenitireducens]
MVLLPILGAAQNSSKFVSVNKSKIAYKFIENPKREPNDAIIVFESGLGMGGGNFEPVFQYLPKNASYFVYDRNGLGQSDTDQSLKSDSDIVARLHEILTGLEIKPPYLLVGHSLGGAFIRLYESKFQDEVSGMVFIDPTDFMLSETENKTARIESKSAIGYRELWPKMLSDMVSDPNMPKGVRAEMQQQLETGKQFFREYRDLPPVGKKPIAVLIAYNRHVEKHEEELAVKLGIKSRPWFDAFDELRIRHYSNMIEDNQKGFLMLLPRYSHGVHNQDPELVGNVISTIWNAGNQP